MIYEFFISWRYLFRRNLSPALLIAFAISIAIGALGGWLFFASGAKAAGAILMLLGIKGALLSGLLMIFRALTAISVFGLSLGVSILVWVLAVTSGFQSEFRTKVLGVNAHVLVLKYGIDFTEYREVMRKVEAHPGVVAAAPFLFNEMMLARGNRLSGVLVKGVDPRLVGRVLDLPSHLRAGAKAGVKPWPLPQLLAPSTDERGRSTGTLPGLIVGRALAEKLGAKVGDALRLISPLSGLDIAGWSAGAELPRSRDFRLTAIFDSGFAEYDKRLVYLHLREAQSFFDQGDAVTGVEMKIAEVFAAPRLARELKATLGGMPYRTVDWGELNHTLFTALVWQKLVLQIVIGLTVVVAAFNVLAALAVLVIRKTREISILKSLGMSSVSVARLFQSAGILVWMVGTSLGLGMGYLGCAVLKEYGFPLDPKIYLISTLPVRMQAIEFVVTALFALVICLLATLYPAWRAARLDPVAGLRY